MIIIAQPGAVVNVFQEKSIEKNAIKDNKINAFGKKITEMKQKNTLIADKMNAFNVMRADRIRKCANTIHYYKCPCCGEIKIANMERCRDKMCPLCNWILARQRLNNMIEIFNHIDTNEYDFYFLTLTIRNVKPEQINKALKSMSSAWDKMMKRKDCKLYIKGWARSVEITYNKITDTLHPHYHIILIYKKGEKRVLSGSYFKPAWKDALNIEYNPIIDFRPIKAKNKADINNEDNKRQEQIYNAVLETFKYSTKSNDLLDMPINTFQALVNGINNKRMVSFGGLIKTMRAKLNIDEEAEKEIELKATTCNCGAEMLQCIAEWSISSSGYNNLFTKYLKGV